MRVIRTRNSVYEVEDGRIRRAENSHARYNHRLSDGEWHDLDWVETDAHYAPGSYVFQLADGHQVITSTVESDEEYDTV